MKKANLLLILMQVGAIIAAWRILPPQVPLFYSRPWGEEQLTPPASLLILPAISLLVFLINLFLPSFISHQEKLLAKIMAAASTVFSLLCLATLIQIIRLIVS